MRTIVVTPSGYGHLHPLIPLARALEAAGHTVTVATTGDVVEEVRRLGLDARSIGPPGDPPPFRSFGGPAIDSLLAMSEELGPDVFVHDHTARPPPASRPSCAACRTSTRASEPCGPRG